MPKLNPHANPDPELVTLFGTLTNRMGLVPMQIKRAFAPYLLDAIAGFDPFMSARLFLRGDAVPVDDKGQIIKIEVTGPVEPSGPVDKPVEIPINWADLHDLELRTLAQQISRKEKRPPASEARDIIVAELKRRDDHDRQQDAA